MGRGGGRDQPVAQPPHGLDAGLGQLLAQPAHEHLDGVGVAVEVLGVDVFGQFGARDHRARAVHQVVQHFVFVAGQGHGLAIERDAAAARVQRQRAALQHRRGLPTGAADQRTQARQQLFQVEGFGQVVVGPGVDAGHLLVPVVARGQDQHRHRAAGIAPALEHRQPVEHRQAQVEHHRVKRLRVAQEVGLAPVVGLIHRVASFHQARAQLRAQGGFVFNQQDAHGMERGWFQRGGRRPPLPL
ncbi:peptidase [Hydrogenophaga taeniospiralis CCUG 15921]|uniref:Peptidase n=1 Tax=Hydrogenophaga taeniospiralis CCUG 15921 TaxID=1281780 RepID=A0A9X4S844_9BURK|nr:peptidase [Hydrogenophaga taeniospiralis CCUG 15921]